MENWMENWIFFTIRTSYTPHFPHPTFSTFCIFYTPHLRIPPNQLPSHLLLADFQSRGSISASSFFSFIEHPLVVSSYTRVIQESDICCTTSMYGIQSRCIPYEIDLWYFKICITSNKFNNTLMCRSSIFCS